MTNSGHEIEGLRFCSRMAADAIRRFDEIGATQTALSLSAFLRCNHDLYEYRTNPDMQT